MKSEVTIKKHIRALRKFIDAPSSGSPAPQRIIKQRLAYLVETVLRFETETTVGWRQPIDEVMAEAETLARDLKL